MKIKVFSECSNSIGMGHISRCSSLYDEAVRRGTETEFYIYGDIENIGFLNNREIRNDNWLSKDFLIKNITDNDLCIVDSYLATKELYDVISIKSKKALFIDDTARIAYPKGIIVNPSLCADGYYTNNTTIDNTYLVGAKYIILRTPFISSKRSTLNENVSEILIIMGGTDIRCLLSDIVNELPIKFPDIKFNVVAINEIKVEKARPDNVEIFYNIDAAAVKNMMLKSDFAITAAGQTIYELLATQTPFIPIKVAENQKNNIKGLQTINSNQNFIEYDEKRVLEKLENEILLMLDLNVRKIFNNKYQNCVDGLGSIRIIDELLANC